MVPHLSVLDDPKQYVSDYGSSSYLSSDLVLVNTLHSKTSIHSYYNFLLYIEVPQIFSLVWGVMNILNVLHGTFLMLGGYVTFWLFELYGIDPFIGLPISILIMFCVGYLTQYLVINLVIKAPLFITLVLTFGLELFAVNMALHFWTGDYRAV